VIIHDAIGEDSYLLGGRSAFENIQKVGLGCIIVEYVLSTMPSTHDVVVCTIIRQLGCAHITMLYLFCQNAKHPLHIHQRKSFEPGRSRGATSLDASQTGIVPSLSRSTEKSCS
jgi:hypothetical protein